MWQLHAIVALLIWLAILFAMFGPRRLVLITAHVLFALSVILTGLFYYVILS